MKDIAPLSGSTSASLIARVSEWEAESWERLVALYSPLVYRWCRQSYLQQADIEDVAQEVFQGVAKGIQLFREDENRGKFRAWLWGIARHKIADHFRNNRPDEVPAGENIEQLLVSETPPEDSVAPFNADAAIMQRAMKLLRNEFEETTWQVFCRIVMDSQKPADVAEEFGMTKKAVRQAKYRVLRRLRIEMERQIE